MGATFVVRNRIAEKEHKRARIQDQKGLEGTVLDIPARGGVINLTVEVIPYLEQQRVWGRAARPDKLDPSLPTYSRLRKIRQLKIPYSLQYQPRPGLYILDDILNAADDLVGFEGSPEETQFLADRFFAALARRLSGKAGLLNRHVFGFRCRHSGRAVFTPNSALRPGEAGIPKQICRRAQIEAGDAVLISRSPILHEGSVLAMKAIPIDGWSIQVGPLAHSGLGVDADGDELAVHKVDLNKSPNLTRTFWTSAGSEAQSARWPTEFLLSGHGPDIDMDKGRVSAQKDVERRLEPLGASLTPSGILEPATDEFLAAWAKCVGELTAEHQVFVSGCSEKQFSEIAEYTTLDLAFMKVNLGRVGAITTATAVLLMTDKRTLSSALRLKEQSTQTLLDTKHGGKDFFRPERLEAILSRQGVYRRAEDYRLMLKGLKDIGLPDEVARPVLQALWPEAVLKISMDSVWERLRIYPEISLLYGRGAGQALLDLSLGATSDETEILKSLNQAAPIFSSNFADSYNPPKPLLRTKEAQLSYLVDRLVAAF
jgi:hypothetical protein